MRGLRFIFGIVGSYLVKCAKPTKNQIYPVKVRFFKQMSELLSSFRSLGWVWRFQHAWTLMSHFDLLRLKCQEQPAFSIACARPEASQGFVLGQLSWEGARTLEDTLVNAPQTNLSVWDVIGFYNCEWQWSLKSLISKAFLSFCLHTCTFIWSFP